MSEYLDQEKVWNALAKSWNNYRQKPWKDIEEYLSFLSTNSGKVLEIGCGNCRNLISFAEKGYDCYGIDFSDEMLKAAKELAKIKNFRIKLKKARAEKIPFEDKLFDYVLSIAVIHHLKKEDQLKALKEMFRVLNTDGTGVISVWNHFNPKFWKYLFRKETFVPWKIDGQIHKRYYYFFNYWELRSIIRQAGFKIAKSSSPFSRNLVFVVQKSSSMRKNY